MNKMGRPKRLKSVRGHRWRKGHSCASNPENTHHRVEARSRFFQKIEDSSLTVEALAKHTATLAVGSENITLTVDPGEDHSIGKSFNTFASKFTTYTNVAFEKFFQNGTVDSEAHMNMLAVHATAQKYIEMNKLPDTCTSYLCAFVTSLEGIIDNEDLVAATLSMMARVIRKVSPDVLKLKYGEIERLLNHIFDTYAEAENKIILINVIGCLSTLMRSQSKSYWEIPFAKNLLKKILEFTIHDDVKVRKCAQYNVSAILKGSSFMLSSQNSDMDEFEMDDDDANVDQVLKRHFALKPMLEHPSASYVGNFILDKLRVAVNISNGNVTLHLLVFLQQVITVLPKDIMEKCCSRILGIMNIGDSTVNGRSLKVFQVLFSSDSETALTKDINEALLNALIQSSEIQNRSLTKTLKLVPSMNNAALALIWMKVVSFGIINLTRFNEESGVGYVPQFIKLLVTFWRSDSEDVHEMIFFTIEYLLDDCFGPAGEKLSSNYAGDAFLSFEAVEGALSMKYETAWPFVFRTLAAFYRSLGKYHPQEMAPCLNTLAIMSHNLKVTQRPLLESVIGAAVLSIGCERVLEAVPIQITGTIEADEKFLWLLPLLKKYVKGSQLCFFQSYFLHLANKCLVVLKSDVGRKSKLLVNTYELIERQLWSLFPSFANEATDIQLALTKQNANFAKMICDNIKFREDIRLDLLAGLRSIIFASADDPAIMTKYSKNYLPVLFNIYLSQPREKVDDNLKASAIPSGQRLAALTTIQTYLRILPPSTSLPFFNEVMKRYQDTRHNSFMKRALLNLARAFIPYLDSSTLWEVFILVKPGLQSLDLGQKAVYRLIEDILNIQHDVVVGLIGPELIESLLEAKVNVASNAKASRMKCLSRLLSHLDPEKSCGMDTLDLMTKIIMESVLYCSRKNSVSARKAAFQLLTDVGTTMQRLLCLSADKVFHMCLQTLLPLDPESSFTSNSVVALTVLFNQHKDIVPHDTLVKTLKEIMGLLINGNRGVIKSSLAFVKLMLKHYAEVVLSDLVDNFIEAILQIPEYNRKKFRLKIRDILATLMRKYGADRIKALIPKEDVMSRMLINIIKAENRKKRIRKLEENSSINEEERQEPIPSTLDEIIAEIDRDIEKNPAEIGSTRKQKNKKLAWIVEGEDDIVDLLDVSSGEYIKSKRPTRKEAEEKAAEITDDEKYGFKIDRKTKKFIISEKWKDKEPHDDDEEEDDFKAFEDLNEIVSNVKGSKGAEQSLANKRKRAVSEGSTSVQIPPIKKVATFSSSKSQKKFDYGREFRAKKAGGDVMKKGGVAPYAYVQFSKQKLNKRKEAKYKGQYKELVKRRKSNKGGRKKKIKN